MSAVKNITSYFNITRTVPADLEKATSVTGETSKKNSKVQLRRVLVNQDISIERRKVFCTTIANAARMKCWGAKVIHNDQGSIVNLWWDGRVAKK